jgi:hypothetical protein
LPSQRIWSQKAMSVSAEQDHRQRRGVAEVVARADDGEEDLGRQHLVAAAQHDRVAEIGEALDEGEQEGRREAGAQQRPCHGAEGLESPRAEGARGFLERRVDRLERAEQHEEGDRREGQHLRDQDAGQAVDPAARPHAEEVGDETGDEAPCARRAR